MDIAYKNADELIKQEMAAEFNAAKTRLSALETALAAAESNISDLQIDLTTFKAAVELDFVGKAFLKLEQLTEAFHKTNPEAVKLEKYSQI